MTSPSEKSVVVAALVADLNDPLRLGRVRVKYPHLGMELSDWARLVTPAGAKRGVFWRPEVGDEVIVAFEQNNPRRACILGGVWSTADRPPGDDSEPAANNLRFATSRSGHLFRFDDTPGSEKIEILDKTGNHKIVIDSAHHKIQVTCDSGDVEISAKSGAVKIDAMTVEVKSSANMTLEASGTLTIKGAMVNIN